MKGCITDGFFQDLGVALLNKEQDLGDSPAEQAVLFP